MIKKIYKKLSRVIPMDVTRVLVWDVSQVDHGDNDDSNTREEGINKDSLSKGVSAYDQINSKLTQHLAEFQFSLVDAHQLQAWTDKPQYELNAATVNTLNSSNVFCVAVFSKDELAAYMFFCNSPVEPGRNSGGSQFTGIGLTFPGHVRYLYKALVLPNFRGQRLASSMMRFAALEFHDDGVNTLVTTTDWTNTGFLRASQHVGFSVIGTAAELILAGKRQYVLPKAFAAPATAVARKTSEPSLETDQNIRLFKP